MPQLAVAVAVLVAVAIDALHRVPQRGPVELEFAAGPLVTTSDPLSCTVRLIGVRRPVIIAPAVRPNVQRFLIDGGEPGIDRARTSPARRWCTPCCSTRW